MPQAAPQTLETRHLAVQQRAAQVVPASFRDADNTLDVVWTTGSRRRAYDWSTDQVFEEELEVSSEAVDMSRFEAGAVAVLDGHNVYGGVNAILGTALSGSITKGEGRAQIRLSQRDELAGLVADIKAGIIRNISFGYSVQRYEITRAQDRTDGVNLPLYRAVRWTPQEISFVTIPADPNAGTRSQSVQGEPCEFVRAAAQLPVPKPENTMTEAELQAQRDQETVVTRALADLRDSEVWKKASPTYAAETARVAAEAAVTAATAAAVTRSGEITDLCQRHGLPQLAGDLIRSGKSTAEVGLALLNEMAQRDAATGGHRNVRVQVTGDELATRIAGIEEAILVRVDSRAKITDNGRQYTSRSMLELGRQVLELRGVNTSAMTRMELASAMLSYRTAGMHSTSDFANIFSTVARKRLRQAYLQQPPTYTMWARRAPNLVDFKPTSIIALSGAPELLKVNEHGEFTYGTLSDGAETYKLLTYGRIVALTRQAIINDDLRAFDRLVSAFGDSAARLENRLVYSEITANALMSDGQALFSTAHKNLGTGAGSALQLSSLQAGRASMRQQVGAGGEQLNTVPRYLIVPAALESLAYQLTSSQYTPTSQAGVNEFAAGGRTSLTVIVEPLLDAASVTAWYLASDNGSVDTVEYAFLDGEEGPVIETKDGFEVDGTSWKCREDFAAKAADFRGLYKSAGV